MKLLTQLLLLLTISTSVYSTEISTRAEESFTSMKKLVGLWKLKDSNSAFRIQFELTANDSVLVETWISKGKNKSLTIYHRDQKRLLATHYCPQGNQPRLVMKQEASSSLIEFNYLDATNLKSIDDSHQHYLAFEISAGHDVITRKESYLSSGKENFDELILIRDE